MKTSVALPGDATHWPQHVAVDGRAAVVIERDGRPVVVLPRGSHRITGEFIFSGLPEGLQIPAEAALVTLQVEGVEIRFPRRDENGMLWLQSAVSAEEENERLDVTLLGIIFGPKAQDGSIVRAEAGYDVTDGLEVTLGMVFYQQGELFFFTNIAKNDRIFFELKYSF